MTETLQFCTDSAINGRKRHILVDTEGFIIKAHISRANMNDRDGVKYLVKGKVSKTVKKIWADMGYRGKQLKDFMKVKGIDLEIVPSFTVLPRRSLREPSLGLVGIEE